MTDHDVDCYPPPDCMCRSGGSLGILKEVQRLYEERLELIERNAGDNKMQLKVDTLKSWVCDLVSQNSLLIRVVEELEAEATTRLLLDRKRHAERTCSDLSCTSELKILNDSLQIENRAKDREIARLNKESQQYENNITCLRKELSQIRYHTPRDQRDAEIMVGMCCTGQDCGKEMVPIRESGAVDDSQFNEPSSSVAGSKFSLDNVRTLRENNVALRQEVSSLKQLCLALQYQNQTALAYAQFRDEIIKEMRRQLKCHKNKLRHMTCRLCDMRSTGTSQDSASLVCRRRRPLSVQPCAVDVTQYDPKGEDAHDAHENAKGDRSSRHEKE